MTTQLCSTTQVTAIPRQISADLSGEAVILNFQDGSYYGLNEVGARIWNLVQQPQSIRQIVDTVVAEYEVEAEDCEEDVKILLEELASHGLVRLESE